MTEVAPVTTTIYLEASAGHPLPVPPWTMP